MNRQFATAALIAAIALVTASASATPLLFDDFLGGGLGTGDGTSVNGGFVLGNNNNGNNRTSGSAAEDAAGTGYAVSSTGTDSAVQSGVVSANSFDMQANKVAGVKVTWSVASADHAQYSGNHFLLQDENTFLTHPSLGIRIIDTAGDGSNYDGILIQYHNGSSNLQINDPGTIDPTELADGFDVVLIVDQAGWSLEITDITAGGGSYTNSDSWQTGYGFDDLFDSTTFVASHIQTGNGVNAPNDDLSQELDSVLVEVVPEPATLSLLGLGALSLLRRRRA